MPCHQNKLSLNSFGQSLFVPMRVALFALLCFFPHAQSFAHGDPLAADTTMVFGYVDASAASYRTDVVLISQTGSEGPLIEAEVHNGVFFVLGLPKGEYRLASLKGERRIIGKVTSTIDLGRYFRFFLDGSPIVFLGAYSYVTTDIAPPKQAAPEQIANTFQVARSPVRRVPLNEPSETELLDRIAKVIANKSELAPYRQYLDRITKRKAEIAAGDPLTRKIQEARANGQWSSVVAHVRHQAERGNPVFLTAMAQMHATGLGTPANLELSLDMFAKAASQNYAPAQFQVGYFLITTTGNLKNTATGSRLLESATAQGYSEAEFAMGQLAHSGALSPVDEAKAFEWYEKAAKQGFSKAWTNLGVLSATARTLPRDPAKARLYLLKAAAVGESTAHFNLAQDYLRDNTSTSLERAYFHALLAEHGDARSPCIPPALWVAARAETAVGDLLPQIIREEAARQSCMVAIPPARNMIVQIESHGGPTAPTPQKREAIKQEALAYLAKRALIDATIVN